MMKIPILVVIDKQITVLDRAARNSGKVIHKELYAAIDTRELSDQLTAVAEGGIP